VAHLPAPAPRPPLRPVLQLCARARGGKPGRAGRAGTSVGHARPGAGPRLACPQRVEGGAWRAGRGGRGAQGRRRGAHRAVGEDEADERERRPRPQHLSPPHAPPSDPERAPLSGGEQGLMHARGGERGCGRSEVAAGRAWRARPTRVGARATGGADSATKQATFRPPPGGTLPGPRVTIIFSVGTHGPLYGRIFRILLRPQEEFPEVGVAGAGGDKEEEPGVAEPARERDLRRVTIQMARSLEVAAHSLYLWRYSR
jgi:hypothetical protein